MTNNTDTPIRPKQPTADWQSHQIPVLIVPSMRLNPVTGLPYTDELGTYLRTLAREVAGLRTSKRAADRRSYVTSRRRLLYAIQRCRRDLPIDERRTLLPVVQDCQRMLFDR